MNAEWFAPRLHEMREQRGWTQQHLADVSGLTREGVAQLETGRREPAWRTVIALCKALEVTADAFLQEPSARPDVKRGRPRKMLVEDGETPKKTAGRRKKK
jgi:transcriptional regulator with XRE-family HTH domain